LTRNLKDSGPLRIVVKSTKKGGKPAQTADMDIHSNLALWGLKNMKRLVFLIGGAGLLALGGCNSSNQDQVSNAEINQPAADDLNALANDAAANAEDQALSNQEQNLDENAAADNGPNPSEEVENNVDAM
jgi:hypothetical protein